MYFDPVEAGKRVKKLREALGYTQEQFSEKIHVSRNYLSNFDVLTDHRHEKGYEEWDKAVKYYMNN